MLSSIIFSVILLIAIAFFVRNVKRLISNIQLGRSIEPIPQDLRIKRWKMMIKYALGQRKMTVRPISGALHTIVYIGFIVVNIELIEILIDGIFSTHRIFRFFGIFYSILIATFEFFSVLVILSVVLFWIRRNVWSVERFKKKELLGWAKKDANLILYFEFFLMFLFLLMNASDYKLQQLGQYNSAGYFPISSLFSGVLPQSVQALILIERTAWWLHIIGILCFLNYLYYSKHLHVILAFPTTFYASLKPKGQLDNNLSVYKEVKIMLGESVSEEPLQEQVERFGVCDVPDLTWVQIMSAYSCTECGRCTDSCPANQTGKLLSPRKIMMNVRDRAEQIGKNNLNHKSDNKNLFDYIQEQEIWACTSCNACVEACPININPLEVIIGMRQYLVMEESKAPQGLLSMMNNIENNGAPWPYNAFDRTKWMNQNE